MFKSIKLTTFIIFLNILTVIVVAYEGCADNGGAITVTNDLSLWISGIVFAVLLGLKAGIGGGLANLNKRQIVPLIVLYSFMVMLAGFIFEGKDGLSIIFKLINIFPIFYAVMSLMLIALGIYTVKIWQSGQDISRRSFWALASPCPLLIVSLILVLLFMPVDLSDFWKVLFVALGLSATIVASHFAGRLKASPVNLGNLMIAAGLGLMAAVLIIPAYLEMNANIGVSSGYLGNANNAMRLGNILVPLAFCSVFVVLGVAIESIKRRL